MASNEDAQYWDELLAAYERPRVGFEFEEAENGCMEETKASMKRRIHAK